MNVISVNVCMCERKAERSLRRAVGEAETMVLLKENDRLEEKLLFSFSKTCILMRKGLRKAPLGDPSDEQRTEGAEGRKKRPPGVKKYGFT